MNHIIRPEKAEGECLGIALSLYGKMDIPQIGDKFIYIDETGYNGVSLQLTRSFNLYIDRIMVV